MYYRLAKVQRKAHTKKRSSFSHHRHPSTLDTAHQTTDTSDLTTLFEHGEITDAQVLQLQRTIGNQATVRLLNNASSQHGQAIQRLPNPFKKKTTPTTPSTPSNKEDENYKNVEGFRGQVKSQTVNTDYTPETEAHDYVSDVAEISGFSSDATGVVGEVFGNFGGEVRSAGYDSAFKGWLKENGKPLDTKFDKLSDKEQEDAKGHIIKEGGIRAFGDDTARTGLDLTGSSAEVLASGLTGFSGFVAMALSIKKAHAERGEDQLEYGKTITDAIGQGAQGILGTGQTLSSTSKTIASGVASTGDKTAETAAEASGGVTEMLGSIGSIVELGVNTTKGVLSTIQYVRDVNEKGFGQRERIVEILTSFLKAGKAFLSTAKSIISIVKTFLEIVGKGGEFANAVPIIGASINIFIQLVDILIQAVEMISQLIKLIRSKIYEYKLKKINEQNTGPVTQDQAEEKSMTEHLAEINRKRWKRTIIPLIASSTNVLADSLSICASVLNIVGAATSAAYGAGLAIMGTGYGLSAGSGFLKLGAALMKPAAAATRFTKQKIRDVGGKGDEKIKAGNADQVTKTERFAKWTGGKLHINMDKTTKAKEKRYQQSASTYIKSLKALPDYDKSDKDVVAKYKEKYYMLKATGVDTKAVFKESDPQKRVHMIIDAMHERT